MWPTARLGYLGFTHVCVYTHIHIHAYIWGVIEKYVSLGFKIYDRVRHSAPTSLKIVPLTSNTLIPLCLPLSGAVLKPSFWSVFCCTVLAVSCPELTEDVLIWDEPEVTQSQLWWTGWRRTLHVSASLPFCWAALAAASVYFWSCLIKHLGKRTFGAASESGKNDVCSNQAARFWGWLMATCLLTEVKF